MNVTGHGVSGTVYGTLLCQFGLPFLRGGGVYVFCKRSPIGNQWLAVYVGETDDFNDRLNVNLKNHHRWDCIQRERATAVCIYYVAGVKANRTTIETDLRAVLNPPCNRQ